ncbi:MAG: glycosyltransferase family 2 protein [Methylotenera sp.]|nr:glycosyltransferase family 2 protein [Methylotenera sp.]MDO9234335.1 glycosyltransferase family 2 protein [Methylotenera sp.]MDO9389051.1 glycosyltransferase family 2 protein [Methylotenera sp.]MDP2101222.1 glycosyltransferase family 2 protein [Methylotenera sp.]MDP2280934.1 glycosyltransferase family 2 protein [Methylotenera sp.]
MSIETKPQISVIIVNFNTADYLLACLNSLQKQTQVLIEIIVVDNASTDNSIEVIESFAPSNLKLIKSMDNLGFGRANNLAVKYANGDYILLLNPDTSLDSPLTIFDLLNHYQSNNFGFLAPLINEPRKNKFVYPKYKYPGQKYAIFTKFNQLPGEIAWVLGACIFMTKSLYNELQGFDPDFFLYGEDVDICLRARKLGYKIGFNPNIQITHIGGASEFKSDNLDKWIRKRKGAFLFLKKHYRKFDLQLISTLKITSAVIRIIFLKICLRMSIGNKNQLAGKIDRDKATIISFNINK